MYALLGHDGPPEGYWRENLITDAPLVECPLRTILRAADSHPDIAAEVERYSSTYYPAYKDGHLLVAGGIADQPARYLALIDETRSMEARTLAKLRELTKDTPPT